MDQPQVRHKALECWGGYALPTVVAWQLCPRKMFWNNFTCKPQNLYISVLLASFLGVEKIRSSHGPSIFYLGDRRSRVGCLWL